MKQQSLHGREQAALNKPSMRWLLPFFKPYYGFLTIILLLVIISTILSLSYPFFAKILIDDVFINQRFELWLVILIGVLAGLVGAVLQAGNGYFYLRVSLKILQALRLHLFSRVQSLRQDFFLKTKIGDITTRINGDLAEVQGAVTDSLLQLLSSLITLIFITGMLVWLDGKLFVFGLICVPILLASLYYFRPKVIFLTRKLRESHSEIQAHLVDTFAHIRLIKLSVAEKERTEQFEQKIDQLNRETLRYTIVQSLAEGIPRFAVTLSLALVLFVGGYKVLAEQLSLGSLFAFTAFLSRFFQPVQSLASIYLRIQRAQVSLERIGQYLHYPTEDSVTDGGAGQLAAQISSSPAHADQTAGFASPLAAHASLVTEKGRKNKAREEDALLSFVQVSSQYAGRTILENISFSLSKGESLAFLGPSGIGKSTLIDLVVKLKEVESGQIYFQGESIRQIAPQMLRQRISVVSQEVAMLHETIRGNLLLGLSKEEQAIYTDERIRQVCQQVGIHQYISSLPEQYETEIGQRGNRLSGGQKQRLAIARALLREPALLILDEATSGLDQEAENQIYEELRAWVKQEDRQRALVIITHREQSIAWVDQVYWLEEKQERTQVQGSHVG